MAHSDAHKKYLASKTIDYEKWHEGEGYDLNAFAQMTSEEREAEVQSICDMPSPDWRDLQVLRVHNTKQSIDRLRSLLARASMDVRVYALRELIKGGHTPGSVADVQLAHLLNEMQDDDTGLTQALLIAQNYAGPMSRLALLHGARKHSSVALHFASALLDLAQLSDDLAGFDPKFRPALLKLLPECTQEERAAAFSKICAWLNIRENEIPEQGSGKERAWAEKQWGCKNF
ncbi:MAG TPA: hypothetical protein VG711_06575 [Phycisphaerales bacterium]|nr:hypothetical protein [Phycisphaerales bacterium]